MKIIYITILSSAIVLGFWFSINKSMDNRCDYYRTLNMTDVMKEMCP